jgi:hypothetical protein
VNTPSIHQGRHTDNRYLSTIVDTTQPEQ